MSGKSSYPEFSLDDVYTGEPKEKTSWRGCAVLMLFFIVFLVIVFSLPQDMQSAVSGFVDLMYIINSVGWVIYCVWFGRKKPETENSETELDSDQSTSSQRF
ncbi:MAG: hypothetical protein ACFFF9_17560 [Candidatus Thorarchaeota archaeon]